MGLMVCVMVRVCVVSVDIEVYGMGDVFESSHALHVGESSHDE